MEFGRRHFFARRSKDITGGLDEKTRDSICNRSSAGGRHHSCKRATARKFRSPVRTNGRERHWVQRYSGRGRNTAHRNYRPGDDDKKEGCQGSAQEAPSSSGFRKPHSPIRAGGRGCEPAGALISDSTAVPVCPSDQSTDAEHSAGITAVTSSLVGRWWPWSGWGDASAAFPARAFTRFGVEAPRG